MANNLTIPEQRPAELEQELTTYAERFAEIRKNVGKFVLIHGSTDVDYYESYEKALEAGYEMYGLKNFLVKEVKAKESPVNILRCSVRPVVAGLRIAKKKARR